jgi:D-alanyl-D-alanine carboxypeptidase
LGILIRYFTIWLFVCCCLESCYAKQKSIDSSKKAAIVIRANTGETVYSENPDAKRYPASLTKMMTLLLLFEAIEKRKVTLGTKFKVSALATRQQPSKLELRVGERIPVRALISALAVKSANDVAVVVAEGLSGSVSSFCKLMNNKCRELGMKNSHFVNPSGLPDQRQISTARDMAKLGITLYKRFPKYWQFLSQKFFCYKNVTHKTHCKILQWYKGADGAKTGYIAASGFNLFVTAKRDGDRVFVVVMGRSTAKLRDFYAAHLMDIYLKKCAKKMNTLSPSRFTVTRNMKAARKDLSAQIGKSEMIEQVVHADDEIPVSEIIKSIKLSPSELDNLYKDEEVINEEDEILASKVR